MQGQDPQQELPVPEKQLLLLLVATGHSSSIIRAVFLKMQTVNNQKVQ